MRVVILHDVVSEGARSDEKDALVQAEAVSQALISLGREPVVLPFSLDLRGVTGQLRRLQPDLVFNLVESVESNGSLIHLAPALLDVLGLPFTGSPTEAIFSTSNKPLAKRTMAGADIATPPWHTPASLRDNHVAPGRYILKSVWEHASVGLDETAVVEAGDRETLAQRLAEREEQIRGPAFAERYIDGREFNISLLADGTGLAEVLPHAEIQFLDYGVDRLKIVGYAAKWDEGSFEYAHTPRRFDLPPKDAPLLKRLSAISRSCWDVFGLRGYARVDFRVDAAGQPWVLEVNANPCLSPDAGFAAAAARAGLDFRRVVERILADVPRRHAASRL